jgi:hypothetical protein
MRFIIILILMVSKNISFAQEESRKIKFETNIISGLILGDGEAMSGVDIDEKKYVNKGGVFYGIGIRAVRSIKKWNFNIEMAFDLQEYNQLLIIPKFNDKMYIPINSISNDLILKGGIGYKFKINELTNLNFDVFYGGAYRFGKSYERNLDVYLNSSPTTREIVVSWNTLNKFCSNFTIDFSVETKFKENNIVFRTFIMQYYRTAMKIYAEDNIAYRFLDNNINYTPILFGVGIGLKF